ncbi:MAG: carboxylate--amine ligase, partial [Flavitalea sp.]
LPAVKRFNHHNGIAPYNGMVAVVNNSLVLPDEELRSAQIQAEYDQCEKAALIVGGKAPIRLDWRANASGEYFLFDLNMKPNLTVASRPHRADQDSLTALAARKIGWSYTDLLINILKQKWKLPDGYRE